MKKFLYILIGITILIGNVYGQSNQIIKLVEQGVILHDKGDYKGAIEKFKKALEIDKKSPLANYEISSSYFAMKNYEKAIEYSDNVISAKSNFIDQAYVVKGSALNLLGKQKESIKTFKKGIKKFPDNYLLYFNLAFTNYGIKDFKEAESALQNALKINPSHASSHLLLGYVMSDQGLRIQSLLAIHNFLLLEPKGNRAQSANKLLDNLLKKGIKKENSTSISITLTDTKDKGSDDFSSAELMLSLLEVSKNIEENKNKTSYEIFTANTNSLFVMLGELNKNKKGFWWNFYVEFFYSMTKEKLTEPYCYYIKQSMEDENISNWLNENKGKVEELINWNSNFKRGF